MAIDVAAVLAGFDIELDIVVLVALLHGIRSQHDALRDWC